MSIEELKRQRTMQLKKSKKSQLPYGLVLLAVILLVYRLFLSQLVFGYVLIYGLLIGYILQRSKICFVASIRDVILFRKTKVLRAVLLGMLVATVGFGIKQYETLSLGQELPGQIATVGMHTVIGGFLFGIGMVIAGGCVSGTFTRIGEGYLLQWVTLIGIFIGTALAIASFETWSNWFIEKAPKIYFGDYIPIPKLVILQVIVLGTIILWTYYKEQSRQK